MSKGEAFIAGVDGGGSGCRAAIANREGRVIGRGTAGSANATTDFAQAVRNVREALAQAAGQAGLGGVSDLSAARAHVGLAGILSAEEGDRFAAELPFGRIAVTDDRPTNTAGALGGRDGLLAAIGTGSFVGAVQGHDMRFLGGWGLQLGDQASGAWLGRALLKQVLLVHDRLRVSTPLTKAVFAEFEGRPNDIVGFARDADPKAFARFARRVVTAGRDGDAVGVDLMKRGAAYLGEALALLDPGPATALCLTGGLGPHYRDWIDASYVGRIVEPAGDALDGALVLAGRLA